MRTIKLYITCSEELALDKNVIGNLVRQLNTVNNPKGISIELWDCEDYDLSDAVQSDMFVALFHKEADKLSFDGVEKANEAYSTKKSPKVFIYFKDLGEGETTEEELTRFKQHLCDELGHFVNRYFSEDSIKFSILMQVMQVEGTEKAEVRSSKVVLGDEQIADLNKIPFAGNNPEYQKLLQELTSVNSEISQFQAILSSMENEALDAMLFQKRLRREQLMKEIEEVGKSLMSTAEQIAGMYGQISSERLRKAVELFESGDNRGANAILDYSTISEELTHNAMMLDQARAVEETVEKALCSNVNECRLKIKTLCTLKAPGWVEECCRIFHETSCAIENRLKDIYFTFTEEYADFLFNNRIYNESCSRYGKIVELLPKEDKYLGMLIRCKGNLAGSYLSLNMFEEARTVYEEIVPLLNSDNNEDKRRIASIRCNMGYLYYQECQYALAEKEYNEALTILEDVQFESHEDYDRQIADTLINMSLLYSERNRNKEAISLVERALNIMRNMSDGCEGMHKGEIASAMTSLASYYSHLGLYAEAEKTYDDTLSILRDVAAESPQAYSSELARCLCLRGIMHKNTATYDIAEKEYCEALEINRKQAEYISETYVPIVANTLGNLAGLHILMDKYDSAEKEFDEVLEIYHRLACKDASVYKPYIAWTLGNRSLLFKDTNRNEQALIDAKESLNIYKSLAKEYPDVYDSRVANTYGNIARIYKSMGQYDLSTKKFDESVSIYEIINRDGIFDSELALNLGDSANTYKQSKKYEEAKERYEAALLIYRNLDNKTPGAYDEGIGRNLANYAQMLNMLDQSERAVEMYLESIECYSRVAKKASSKYATVALLRKRVAEIYFYEFGDCPRAEVQCKQAIKLYEELGLASKVEACCDFLKKMNKH